jgi:hypothetical protein
MNDTARKLSKRSFAQIGMLTAELLLGMAVNLIGVPSQTTGGAQAATTIFLSLHVLIGIGLIVGSLLTVRLALKAGPQFIRLAWAGVVLIALTFIAGALTMATNNNWLSYLMAVGFMASLLLYGALLVNARSLKTK